MERLHNVQSNAKVQRGIQIKTTVSKNMMLSRGLAHSAGDITVHRRTNRSPPSPPESASEWGQEDYEDFRDEDDDDDFVDEEDESIIDEEDDEEDCGLGDD